MAKTKLSIKERFLNSCQPEPNTGCWIYLLSLNIWGYGQFSINSHQKRAHKVSYELFKGPIPLNLTIDHLCKNRWCVNPDHLEAVTMRENNRRGNGWGGINARKTHCNKGHEYTKDNIYPRGNNRECLTCIRLQAKLKYQKKLALKLITCLELRDSV